MYIDIYRATHVHIGTYLYIYMRVFLTFYCCAVAVKLHFYIPLFLRRSWPAQGAFLNPAMANHHLSLRLLISPKGTIDLAIINNFETPTIGNKPNNCRK